MLVSFFCPSTQFIKSITTSNTKVIQEEEVETQGYYYFYGKQPRGFENIDHITVFKDLKEVKRSNLPYPGVYTKRGIAYRFSDYKVTRKKLTFTTISLKGVNYSFEGHYLLANGANYETDGPVLEGVISKYVNGNKVAESKVRFTLWVGD